MNQHTIHLFKKLHVFLFKVVRSYRRLSYRPDIPALEGRQHPDSETHDINLYEFRWPLTSAPGRW